MEGAVTITEELETHPIFGPFVVMCARMSIGTWDPNAPLGPGFMREPHTGRLIYDPILAGAESVGYGEMRHNG